MRMFASALILFSAALLSVNALATPNKDADDVDKLTLDRGLFTQMEHVRQTVTHKASELVVNAMGFLGVRYKRGGNSAETGFDCSGFVRAMYEQSIGLLLPRRAEQQAAATQTIEKTELKPGDLVFFNTMRRAFSHVGIYIGDGKFIHSPKPGSEVRVESLEGSYWLRRFDGARRVKPQSAAADAPQGTAEAQPASAFSALQSASSLTEQQVQSLLQQDPLRNGR